MFTLKWEINIYSIIEGEKTTHLIIIIAKFTPKLDRDSITLLQVTSPSASKTQSFSLNISFLSNWEIRLICRSVRGKKKANAGWPFSVIRMVQLSEIVYQDRNSNSYKEKGVLGHCMRDFWGLYLESVCSKKRSHVYSFFYHYNVVMKPYFHQIILSLCFLNSNLKINI